MQRQPTRILAIASGGGHWVQLLRLRPAFAHAEVAWVTVNKDRRDDVGFDRFHTVIDATRWNKCRIALQALQILWILLRFRPHAIVTTGAAPGLLAIMAGKVMGCRTVWLDSIANAAEVSLSGRRAGRFADTWLTQWSHLAADAPEGSAHGPMYRGAVM